jgi:hypothetical protein
MHALLLHENLPCFGVQALLYLSSNGGDSEHRSVAMFRFVQLQSYLETIQASSGSSSQPPAGSGSTGVSECKSPRQKHASLSNRGKESGASFAALKFTLRQVAVCKKSLEDNDILRLQMI